ncbi:MAG: redoxin domain-containing protein [Bdellovibrio sp.]|nr:redoxin domain-containing protein [Bdellovibrio sp.]
MASVVNDNSIQVDIGELKMCTVLNETGAAIPLRSLWEKQPAIFIFLRHFGCDACRRHALEVWDNRAKYEQKGARLHFIGNGNPECMVDFKKTYNLQEASFFTDPSQKSFKAAGFKRGFWIDPGTMHTRQEFLYKALKFTSSRENAKYGNVWQLGGVLVIKPGGVPAYQFTSLTMGHFPPVKDISLISG